MPKPIFELRNFVSGMIRDLIKRNIPKNKYYNAENINLTPNSKEKMGGASVALGSEFAVELGAINFGSPNNDYQAWKIYFDLSLPNIVHRFVYFNGVTVDTGNFSSASFTSAGRYASLVSQLESTFTTAGLIGQVYIAPTISASVVEAGFRVYGYSATLTENIASIPQDVIVIKEFYGNDNGFFVPLKSIYIDTDLYIISSNASITRLGVAQKNYATGVWTYTVLLQTNQIQIPTTAVIDMDGQIDFGERVSIYFTTGGIPRCFYVKKQDTWVANSAMIYYNSLIPNLDGYYNYNSINTETALQVITNFARAELNTVINSGGSLTTGNKQYYIRQISGDETETGVGVGSGLVSIYTFPTTDRFLYGQTGGQQTTKIVSLNIKGLSPSLYDKFELIVVDNIDGVLVSYIVNRFDIIAEEMTVQHTGNEVLVSFDLSNISTQQVLIKNAQNLVIARNRLFLSNIETQIDYDLSVWAETIAISTEKTDILSLGDVNSRVGEYQVPENIFNTTGYMVNETYRFGIQLFFKNGFVSSPYFVGDHMIDATAIGSHLTDGGLSAPTEVYVFYPTFAVDLTVGSPLIDGIPLQDALYGYSIVRQDCIPEVLASGYIMPAAANQPMAGFYTTGANIAGVTPYTEISTSGRRNQCSFVSPDILFGQTDIEPLQGDRILNYGQTQIYNTETSSTSPYNIHSLIELSARPITPTPVYRTVQNGEVVNFNENGVLSIGGRVLSNTVVIGGYGTVNTVSGNNQKSLALEFNDWINPINPVTDYGFYYAQYFREKTNKYGEKYQGSYKSCGNFRAITASSTYTENVFGGDTFTQKNFIKHCNRSVYTYTRSSGSATFNVSPISSPALTIGNYTYNVYGVLTNGEKFFIGTKSITVAGGDINKSITVSIDTFAIPSSILNNITEYEFWRSTPFDFLGRKKLSVAQTTATYIDTNVNWGVRGEPSVGNTTTFILRTGLSYYTQNRGNYQLRYFQAGTDDDYPYTTDNLSLWISATDELNSGQLLYTIGYSPIQPDTAYRLSFNSEAPIDSVETNILYYSDLKVNDSLDDPFRRFLPINRKSYPAKYGDITNTFLKDVNYLVIMMNEQILLQGLDQQQVVVDGTSTILGDGSVLGAREQPISNIGSPIKTGAIQYKNSQGAIHVAWYNPYFKKLLRFIGGGVNDIGDQTNNQSFLTNNNKYVLENNDIVMGYDFTNDTLLVTAINTISGSTEYSSLSTYNEGDIVWIENIANQKMYFIALMNVPTSTSPLVIENRVQYWDMYKESNYTLCFNDRLMQVEGFALNAPLRYLTFNETYLTQAVMGTPASSYLFEHNKGLLLYNKEGDFEGEEIVSSITIIFNDLNEFHKRFRTVYFDILEKPLYMMVKTANQISYTNLANINFARPHWGANLYNDATITVDNPNGLNTLKTAQIEGNFCEVTVWFKSTDAENVNNIEGAILKMIPQPKYYNK
jgi:hypothetical protein